MKLHLELVIITKNVCDMLNVVIGKNLLVVDFFNT